jgi:thiamine-phosphate pyrophosphorylase
MTLALAAGVRFFQYRNKSGTRKAIYEAALSLVRTAHSAEALFLVNDHADIAAAAGADGVHLGQEDLQPGPARKLLGPGKIIGVSTHAVGQAVEAERAGADYIGFGPLFPTATKNAGEAQGLRNLALVKQSVSIPVIAIGGINHTNVRDAVRAGADGVAVISAVLAASDMQQAAGELINIIRETEAGIRKQGGYR